MMADARRPSHRHDRDSFGVEIAPASLSEQLDSPPIAANPYRVAVSPDGNNVYVSSLNVFPPAGLSGQPTVPPGRLPARALEQPVMFPVLQAGCRHGQRKR